MSGASNSNHVSIILKTTDLCNYACSFCRYARNRADYGQGNMSLDTARLALERAAQFNREHGFDHLHVMFHGGEPLLRGQAFFNDIMNFEAAFEAKYEGFRFENSVQTNGSLIDDSWVNFFTAHPFNIGISLDGPPLLNHHISNLSSDESLENAILLMRNRGIRFGILSVITNDHFGYAEDYYHFLVDNGISNVGLCYCFDPVGEGSVDREGLTQFLKELFDLYFFGSFSLRIREFDNVIKLSLGHRVSDCSFNKRLRCGNFFSVSPNGDIFFCDPFDGNAEELGSVLRCSFEDVASSTRLRNILEEAKESFDRSCISCDVLRLCQGGCCRNNSSAGINYFCSVYKELYPFIEKRVKTIVKEVK